VVVWHHHWGLAMRYLVAVLALVIAGCGKDAASPPPPPPASPPPPPPAPVIVKLVMASDTGFWRDEKISLSHLVRGAITDKGDTVAAPTVTWAIPAGFVRQGDSLRATKEARGELRAMLGSVTDSTTTTVMEDLSAGGKVWQGTYRCYGGAWDATRGTDTVIYHFQNGEVYYSVAPWKAGTFQAQFRFDSVTAIAYLSDATVDTIVYHAAGGERYLFQQDVLSLSVISSDDTIPMERPFDAQKFYRSTAPICTTQKGWQRDGTPWELTAP
jgi:hypothetical protein